MHKFRKGVFALFLSIFGFSQIILPITAGQISEPVTSSVLDANWPQGPSVNSEAAILIEANTGTILYEKDIHKQMYPASITKILTTLIATEMCELDENVTFTSEMLQTIPYDSSRIWVDSGEYMPLEDCLSAILAVSANDVAAGVAEHIGGTLEAFADIMNKRAEELGCLNSHFVNAHGYHDENHYTTAYDMAQIARAFFENELLANISKQRYFKVDASAGQPDDIWELNKNQLLETRAYEYEYLVGSKTGYTSASGQTLVSCAQKDGLKLICVVMNAKSPDQYKDTVSLFDFGFSSFTTANIFEHDKTYVSADSAYGMDVVDVLGDSAPLVNMDRTSIVVLPKTAQFSDTTSYIQMAEEGENCMATAHYQYGSHEIGSAQIFITAHNNTLLSSGELDTEEVITPEPVPEEPSPLYVNIKKIALIVIPSALGVYIFLWVFRRVVSYRYEKNPTLSRRRINHRFVGLKNLFISFARGVQAITQNMQNIVRSKAVRSRYTRRGSASSFQYGSAEKTNYRRRNQRVDYSLKSPSNNAEHRRKNVTFHDINK